MKLDFDSCFFALLGLGQPQPTVTAREERRRYFLEVGADRGEGLVEAPLDGLGELGPKLLELLQARLEVGALGHELGEALLLALVLLLRERVDLAEGFAAALEPLDPRRQLLAVVAFGRLRAGVLEPAPRLRGLGVEPRTVDVDRGPPLARLGCSPASFGFRRAEPSQLRRKLAGPCRAGVHPGLQRGLKPSSRLGRPRERRGQALPEDGQGLDWDRSTHLRSSFLRLLI